MRHRERQREWIVDALIRVPEAAGRVGQADGRAERRSLHLGVVGESRVAGVQEHSGPAANAGLAVTERIVSEAEAWSEVVPRGRAAVFRKTLVARKQHPGVRIGVDLGL